MVDMFKNLFLLSALFSYQAQGDVATVKELESSAQNVPTAAQPEAGSEGAAQALASVPFAALTNFVDVFDTIRKHHVKPPEDAQLLRSALRGLLHDLDPYAAYLSHEEFEAWQMRQQRSSAMESGVGLVLDVRGGAVFVVSALDDTPAQKAGIHSGDVLTHINQQSIHNFTLAELENMLAGDEGSELSLTLLRSGPQVLEVNLKREMLQPRPPSSRMLDENIACLSLPYFQADSAALLKKELEALQAKYTLQGVILDLRNNPGGDLQAGIETADLWMDRGLILNVVGREQKILEKFNARPGDISNALPLVVLVDRGTASTAEVVAGALQDQQRALVVGEPTFGRGAVQSVFGLMEGDALKLTVALYYTPKMHAIQGQGITPDVLLEHLAWLDDPRGDDAPQLVKRDFALYEALNIVRAMAAQRRQHEGKTEVPKS